MSTTTEEVVVNATTGGRKARKLARFDLLPWVALRKVAEHYGVGAGKYADHNWRRGYDWSLSIGAIGRHLAAFVEGEDNDPETGTPHVAAIAFHALTLLTFLDEHPELDDRFATVGCREADFEAGQQEFLDELSALTRFEVGARVCVRPDVSMWGGNVGVLVEDPTGRYDWRVAGIAAIPVGFDQHELELA